MAKEFLGEQTLSKLIQMISTEFKKYVKKTDYATADKAGLVTVLNGDYGLRMSGRVLSIKEASNSDIDGKLQSFRPIVPKNLDYAVKKAITANAQTLTDDEKFAAQTWLGVTDQLGDIETALDGIITIQNELIGGDTV